MGKIRVHELAKEFGIENKDVIKHLQAAGVSVKTHSSSVYEDEAREALESVLKPKPAAEKPRRRPGMVIRRKKKEDVVEASGTESEDEAPVADEAAEAPVAAAAEAEVEPAAAEPEAVVEAAADAPEADAVEAAPVESAEVTESEPAAVEEVKVDATVEASAPEEVVSEPVVAEKTAAAADAPKSAEVAAAPAAKPADGDTPAAKPAPEKKPTGARVVRMIDREKLMERVPSRRLGGAPDQQRPQSNTKSFGQVTELKVVNDPFGRGREMVQVGRDRRGRKIGPGAQPARGARGARGKRGMREMRERAMFPSRLKKRKSSKAAGYSSDVTAPLKASKRVIRMKETLPLADLAHQLGVKAVEIIRKLMGLGIMATQNQNLDYDTVQLIAADYEFKVDSIAFDEAEALPSIDLEADAENLVSRPPVVTVMGHVDHGKTSILDAMRKTRVASGEAGGITQHIGAYSIDIPKKGSITFLDTPGHAAFTEMRARGAQVTDIVVLVVAADDGVMPQTEEAIKHSQEAGVPIIVAVNKMDRPDANADRVTQELAQFGLQSEAWGGDTLFVPTSAITGAGIDDLLEAILLQAEMLELKASEEVDCVGVVVEAKLDKGRGPVATILVRHGKLTRGDHVVVGEYVGRIRAMTDHNRKTVKVAKPSDAVEVIGLEGVPGAGNAINKVASAEKAREVAEHRASQTAAASVSEKRKMSLEDLMSRMSTDQVLELKIVLKADVQGSVEAVKASLLKLSTEEVKVNVIYGGVGAITESDIMLASAGEGLILGFNVRPDSKARRLSDRESVEIRTYNVIYELLDEVRLAMEGLLTPESKETIVGRAEVREVFHISKVGTIAGCRVTEGKARRSAKVRILRDSVEVFDGRVDSLKHFKDDAREVESGQECGCGIEGFNDLKQGDAIEFYEVEQIARTLDASPRRPNSGPPVAHA